MSKITVEILVTRTANDGKVTKARATAEASGMKHGVGDRWLAAKVAHKTLRLLAKGYDNVSKSLGDTVPDETPEEPEET